MSFNYAQAFKPPSHRDALHAKISERAKTKKASTNKLNVVDLTAVATQVFPGTETIDDLNLGLGNLRNAGVQLTYQDNRITRQMIVEPTSVIPANIQALDCTRDLRQNKQEMEMFLNAIRQHTYDNLLSDEYFQSILFHDEDYSDVNTLPRGFEDGYYFQPETKSIQKLPPNTRHLNMLPKVRIALSQSIRPDQFSLTSVDALKEFRINYLQQIFKAIIRHYHVELNKILNSLFEVMIGNKSRDWKTLPRLVQGLHVQQRGTEFTCMAHPLFYRRIISDPNNEFLGGSATIGMNYGEISTLLNDGRNQIQPINPINSNFLIANRNAPALRGFTNAHMTNQEQNSPISLEVHDTCLFSENIASDHFKARSSIYGYPISFTENVELRNGQCFIFSKDAFAIYRSKEPTINFHVDAEHMTETFTLIDDFSIWIHPDFNSMIEATTLTNEMIEMVQNPQRLREQFDAIDNKKNKSQDVPENIAIESLRELISESEFRRYLKKGFIVVNTKSGRRYQIFRDQNHSKVYEKGKLVEEVCVQIRDHNVPKTDKLIAFKTMLETDENEFRKKANIYKMKGDNYERDWCNRPVQLQAV